MTEAKTKEHFFSHDPRFYKRILLLALPMMAQNLITYAVGLADNLMVGRLGDAAVSGVYMGGQVQTVIQVLNFGIEAAILLMAGQYWGKKDTVAIRKILTFALYLSLGIGTVISTVSAVFPRFVIRIFTTEPDVVAEGTTYLSIVAFSFVFFCFTQSLIASMRSVEKPMIGMAVSLVSLLVNVSLNYVLIFGKLGLPALGVKGAAIATLIARICEAAIAFVYVFFIDKRLHFRPVSLRGEGRLIRDFLKASVPLIAGQCVWGINMFSNGVILGHFSEEVITAVSVANTLNNLMYVVVNGFSGGVGVFISKTIGAGETEHIKEYARSAQVFFFGLGLIVGACFFFGKGLYISLYDISEGAAAYSRQFVNVLSVTAIGTCYQAACLYGLVKSGGDVSFVFKNDTFFVFLVVLPSALIATFCGAPAWVVFGCLKVDQLLKCITAFVKIQRYNWMKNRTVRN